MLAVAIERRHGGLAAAATRKVVAEIVQCTVDARPPHAGRGGAREQLLV